MKCIITLKIWIKKLSQEFRLKNIDETRNYLTGEINKEGCHKGYIEQFFILASIITGCISNSSFTFLIGISIRITNCA